MNQRTKKAVQAVVWLLALFITGCDNSPEPPNFRVTGNRPGADAGEDTSQKDIWVNKAHGDGRLGRITFLAVDPHDPSIVYAGSRFGGLIRITNRADGWSNAKNIPIAAQYAVSLNPMDQDMGVDPSEVTSLAVHPARSSTLLVGMGGIFKSHDAGGRWQQVFDRPPVRAIAFDPGNPDRVFAASGTAGCYRSDDGGDTWASAGAELRFVYCLTATPGPPAVLYAGTYGAVSKSTDWGNSWTRISDASAPALAISPAEKVIIAATRQVGENGGGIFKSLDGGQTWENTTDGLEHTDFWACAIDPGNPERMYAGESSGGGVLRSTDGGQTWSQINDGLQDLRVFSLAVDPANPKIIWAGTESKGVFRMVQSD